MRKSSWVLFIFVLIGGLLGGILGEILHVMAPQGTIQNIFSTHFPIGSTDPPILNIDLVLVKLTLGFSIKINILSILGMFIGIYLYKHV